MDEYGIEEWMTPAEKLSRYRAAVPAAVRKRWPTPLEPTPAQLQELSAITSPTARLTRLPGDASRGAAGPSTRGRRGRVGQAKKQGVPRYPGQVTPHAPPLQASRFGIAFPLPEDQGPAPHAATPPGIRWEKLVRFSLKSRYGKVRIYITSTLDRQWDTSKAQSSPNQIDG
jgi:hypothetical protein